MHRRSNLTPSSEALANFFQTSTTLEPRSNITPSQQILVVRCLPNLPGRHLASLRWGLIPA